MKSGYYYYMATRARSPGRAASPRSPRRRESSPRRARREGSPKRAYDASPSEDRPAPNNPANNAYKSRFGNDIDDFHRLCVSEGYICIPCNLQNPTEKEAVRLQNKLYELDAKANAVDERGRYISNQKPMFRYVSSRPNQEIKCHGGGIYLYSSFQKTKDKIWNNNPNPEINGTVPVFFRAKSAVQNTKVPNFSIQWPTVVRFYYKPVPKRQDELVLEQSGKIIRITGM